MTNKHKNKTKKHVFETKKKLFKPIPLVISGVQEAANWRN